MWKPIHGRQREQLRSKASKLNWLFFTHFSRKLTRVSRTSHGFCTHVSNTCFYHDCWPTDITPCIQCSTKVESAGLTGTLPKFKLNLHVEDQGKHVGKRLICGLCACGTQTNKDEMNCRVTVASKWGLEWGALQGGRVEGQKWYAGTPIIVDPPWLFVVPELCFQSLSTFYFRFPCRPLNNFGLPVSHQTRKLWPLCVRRVTVDSAPRTLYRAKAPLFSHQNPPMPNFLTTYMHHHSRRVAGTLRVGLTWLEGLPELH